jgi:ubiquinone/menaquinone biosynthesis C-methylase UbiE
VSRLLDLTGQAEAAHFWFRGFRGFVRPVLAALTAHRRDLLMLDCGCGTGHNLRLLAVHGRPVGVDLASGGLDRARATGCPLAKADIVRIPFQSDRFDLVTSFDVLQCVGADTHAVREMARVTKPGGAVVLTVAAFDSLRGDHAEAWGEVRRYTRSSASRLLEQAGLRVERAQYLFAVTFPIMLVVRTAQRVSRPFRSLRDDTDIAVPSAWANATLAALLRLEYAVSRRVALPFGSSVLVVGRKVSGGVARLGTETAKAEAGRV